MGKAESKEMYEDERCVELREIAEKGGPVAVAKYLQDKNQKWKEEKVSFAVTGRSATGKSTFINKIRDVKPKEPGYAKSGGGNTTTKPQAYQNPQNERIIFFDLPGLGTMEFKKQSYVADMQLRKYDYFFIFFDKDVNEDEYFLICELLKMNKSYCLIRSKIDDDIRNAEDDEMTEEEVIPAIRKHILDQISRYDHLKSSDAIFLISSKRKDLGDWPKLLYHVGECLSPAKFESLMYSLPTLTENVIDVKYKMLRNRIKLATASAALIAATPLPGLDFAINIGILVFEVKHYINVFGLDIKVLDTLTGLDRSQLKCARFLVPEIDFAKIIIANLGKTATILLAESVLDVFLPILGSIVSAGTTSIVTYRYLSSILDDFRDDARFVYRFILDKENPQS